MYEADQDQREDISFCVERQHCENYARISTYSDNSPFAFEGLKMWFLSGNKRYCILRDASLHKDITMFCLFQDGAQCPAHCDAGDTVWTQHIDSGK